MFADAVYRVKARLAAMQQDVLRIMQSPTVGIPTIGRATRVLFDEIQDIPEQQCYPLFPVPGVSRRSQVTNHSDTIHSQIQINCDAESHAK